jgi:hypothetical protein
MLGGLFLALFLGYSFATAELLPAGTLGSLFLQMAGDIGFHPSMGALVGNAFCGH